MATVSKFALEEAFNLGQNVTDLLKAYAFSVNEQRASGLAFKTKLRRLLADYAILPSGEPDDSEEEPLA